MAAAGGSWKTGRFVAEMGSKAWNENPRYAYDRYRYAQDALTGMNSISLTPARREELKAIWRSGVEQMAGESARSLPRRRAESVA